MFPFLGTSAFLRASCQEEDPAPSEQMGALPFASVEFKCHRKGWVVPVGLISSQYVDPSGDLQSLYSSEHAVKSVPPSTCLNPELIWLLGSCYYDIGLISIFLSIFVHMSRKVGSYFQQT